MFVSRGAGLYRSLAAFPMISGGGLRIDILEACSAFTRVTSCSLAEPPDGGPFSPKCFSPCRYLHEPLRLLPAGTKQVAGRVYPRWGAVP